MPKTASQEGFGCLGVGVTGLILVKFHADTGDDHHDTADASNGK